MLSAYKGLTTRGVNNLSSRKIEMFYISTQQRQSEHLWKMPTLRTVYKGTNNKDRDRTRENIGGKQLQYSPLRWCSFIIAGEDIHSLYKVN